MWLTGKPHGHGEMRWPDKRVYMGEFKQGEHHGHGVMVFPPNSPDNADRYEGEWSHGKISGFGKMKYMHGDTYTGHWRDNTRHGHGVMSYGAMSSSAASVYIGEWSADRKNGYGTMDDVIRGEKYMGMWDNDIRQGAGVIVTLDGVYTQGTFVQGKLTGHGLLLCDDNTIFEGEFSGHCQLSGKGQFWLTDGSRSPSKEGEESCDVHHYVSAVEELQQMSTKLSPMEKLACLKTTFEKINQDVERFWRGEEKLVSLDDLFPVFHFVVIRARIPHLGSEIHFIDDMVDAHVHVGEQGHMFTTLKACFFQIQNEKG
ncbi:predicted protein [Nematostella vectensis]|uniref:VPS9 domain-containing protein n=1 Tax=Nematostella vectensis TaxID=45351 RepID=A7RY90_NEMVE|nr:predicted protein [Nematostella vectensis]|eukprot:XP_001635721.1 predicted protein [Nematostella vectensis]